MQVQLISNNNQEDFGFWYFKRQQIAALSKDGFDNFLSWQPIRDTMYVNNPPWIEVEKEYIYSIINDEDCFNDPDFIFKQTNLDISDNTIHHLYHLFLWEEITGKSINTMTSILEFGGGFGSTARLCDLLWFDGIYQIVDFPEIIELQKYYLSQCGIDWIETDAPELDVDLFIAEWSLSETHLERNYYHENLQCNNMLVAYNGQFDNENNIDTFKNFPSKSLNNIWRSEINHIPDNYYLFGWA